MPTHQIIVVGASLGGVEALSRLLGQLPAELPAAVFIVLHTSPGSPGRMAEILAGATPLKVKLARDRDKIQPGQAYVAPPDYHLLVKPGHIHLSRGPKENWVRPAIDPLFRSAGAAYGSQTVGVVLTGMLNDGSAGLEAIKRCNGVAIVQEPAEAMAPDMPSHALAAVEVDYRLPLAEIGPVLIDLARQPAKAAVPVPPDILLEVKMAENQVHDEIEAVGKLGSLAPMACPECGGPLWKIDDPHLDRYRCHVGHAYTSLALLAGQEEAVERSLWSTLRVLEERAVLLESLTQTEQARQRKRSAAAYAASAARARAHAEQIRRLLAREP